MSGSNSIGAIKPSDENIDHMIYVIIYAGFNHSLLGMCIVYNKG